jgi:hypothetical protein
MRQATEFGFGLETEFLLIDPVTGVPHWHDSLTFSQLNGILESIPFEDLGPPGGMEGLELEAPHRKNMPFIVEGYHVPNADFEMIDIRPKGIEIRTPVTTSLEECLSVHSALHARLQKALLPQNLKATCLSHHPVGTSFQGPQNKRRTDFWRWAMEAMLTYGPDVNVSLPHDLARRMDPVDFDRKVNAYAPAMAAFSVASPFLGGSLWKVHGEKGRSVRSWRRSVVAPAIEVHPEEDGRLEFKVFEMSNRQSDYRNFFLLFLTLALDEGLRDREDPAARIYDLGAVARRGIDAPEIRERAAALLLRAPGILREWGFDASSLKSFEERFELRRSPADELIGKIEAGATMESLLLERSDWIHDA